MSKKSIILVVILLALALFFAISCSSSDLDRIQNYIITAVPQKDGSVNLIYELTWEVLDTESEGPLTEVQIGLPNSNVYELTPLTSNIDTVEQYNSTYAKIKFKQAYYEGDVITFKFKINQLDMHIHNYDNYTYKFTPGWFEDIEVENIKVLWKTNKATSANTDVKENGYFVWTDSLRKNEKLETEIIYPEDAFNWDLASQKSSKLNSSYNYELDGFTQPGEFDGFAFLQSSFSNNSTTNDSTFSIRTIFIVLIIVVILSIVLAFVSPDNYYRHRGFGGYSGSRYHDYDCDCDYDHHHHHHSSYRSRSSSSSCACVNKCACACACAGGGRAGCSKKDFYGTKLKSKDILKKL